MDKPRRADETLIEAAGGQTLPPLLHKPTVSVIIPAHNAADYIVEALGSVFAQTFSDFEVIVVNDGSPDTERFERAIQPYRDRIVYLHQENRGPSAARNLAIRTARGEYVAFLDSDDSWLPEYLAEQLRLFEAKPSLDLVYCDALLHGDPAQAAGKTYMQVCPSKGPVTFESLLVEDCQVVTSGTVARRRTLIEAGLFDERFFRSEDHDLWMRVAYRGGSIAYQRKVLLRYRRHPGSLASSSAKLLKEEIGVLRKLESTLQFPLKTRSMVQRRRMYCEASLSLEEGKQQLLAGNVDQGSRLLRRANLVLRRKDLKLILLGLRFVPQFTLFAVRNRKRLPVAALWNLIRPLT